MSRIFDKLASVSTLASTLAVAILMALSFLLGHALAPQGATPTPLERTQRQMHCASVAVQPYTPQVIDNPSVADRTQGMIVYYWCWNGEGTPPDYPSLLGDPDYPTGIYGR